MRQAFDPNICIFAREISPSCVIYVERCTCTCAFNKDIVVHGFDRLICALINFDNNKKIDNSVNSGLTNLF